MTVLLEPYNNRSLSTDRFRAWNKTQGISKVYKANVIACGPAVRIQEQNSEVARQKNRFQQKRRHKRSRSDVIDFIHRNHSSLECQVENWWCGICDRTSQAVSSTTADWLVNRVDPEKTRSVRFHLNGTTHWHVISRDEMQSALISHTSSPHPSVEEWTW